MKIALLFMLALSFGIVSAGFTAEESVSKVEIIRFRPETSLLRADAPVAISATAKLSAKDSFRIGTDGAVKIRFVSTDFAELFGGKEEPARGAHEIWKTRLLFNALTKPVAQQVEGFGGKTTLADIFYLLKKQSSGEQGILNVENVGNIFYVMDAKGVLREVNAVFESGGWGIFATALEEKECYLWKGATVFVSAKPPAR